VRGSAAVLAAAAAAAVAAALAVLAPAPPVAVLVLGCGLALGAAAALHPPAAAYALLALTPLTVGIDRGVLLPLLRPSEALLGVVAAGLVARGLVAVARGAPVRLRLGAVDWALLAFAYAGSVLPLLWMVARGREVSADDLLYASYVWKYAGIYALVRVSVRSEAQVRTCLWVILAAGAVVGAVAVAQSLGVSAVSAVLGTWYSGGETTGGGRGASTLSSPLAVADVMVLNLAIAAGLALRGERHRVLLAAAMLTFALGVVAASQVSGALALAVAVLVVGVASGRPRAFLLSALPVTAAAALLLWPVLGRRLGEFESLYGLPRAWVGPDGRLQNLETFFWPELFSDLNWLTGVRVAARVPAPEGWRDWVWIESGHTWLLWSGGVAFLVACFVFLGLGIRAVAPIARARTDAVGVAALASLAALWIHVVVMAFDVHLTLRGSADLTFALLPLALVAARRPERPPPGVGPRWLWIAVEPEPGPAASPARPPGRIVMVGPGHSFAALAATIDRAWGGAAPAGPRVFELPGGRRAGVPQVVLDGLPVVDDRTVEVRGTVGPGDELTYVAGVPGRRFRCTVLPPGGVVDPRVLDGEPPAAPALL